MIGQTVGKNGRVYPHRFDHDEARARHAAGESIAALARSYGVHWNAVARVVDEDFRAAFDAKTKAHMMSGRCPACGKPGTSRNGIFGDRLCRECWAANIATSVRATTLRCSDCRRWLPDDAFNRGGSMTRRGRGSTCKACKVRMRIEYRNETKVPCEECGRLTLSLAEKNASRRSKGLPETDRCLCQSCASRAYWARVRHQAAPGAKPSREKAASRQR